MASKQPTINADGGAQVHVQNFPTTQAVSGTVTANIGTAGSLALETGGNLATIATAQGAGGTGISQPTGGSGLLGWLSGIYNKLVTTIAVTQSGTWTQRPTGASPTVASTLSITTGGTAQTLFSASATTGQEFEISNMSTGYLYVNDTGASASATAGIAIPPGGYYSSSGKRTTAAISVFGSTTGQTFFAEAW